MKEYEEVEQARINRQNVDGSNRSVARPIIKEIEDKTGPFRHIWGLVRERKSVNT